MLLGLLLSENARFFLDHIIPSKDVVDGRIFYSKLNREEFASSLGSWEVLLINPSLSQEILPISVGSRKLFSLLLTRLCSQ